MLSKIFILLVFYFGSNFLFAESKSVFFLGCHMSFEGESVVMDGENTLFIDSGSGLQKSVLFRKELIVSNFRDADGSLHENVSELKEYNFGYLTGYSFYFYDGVSKGKVFLISDYDNDESIMFLGFSLVEVNDVIYQCGFNF